LFKKEAEQTYEIAQKKQIDRFIESTKQIKDNTNPL
jgi:hypothetical protein